MKIAYDAKRFFHNASGLGNYSRDLVRILATNYSKNEYFLLSKNKNERGAEILALNNVYHILLSKGFLARQIKMGEDAQRLGIDIFHGLSGELPLKWKERKIKKIVTIHDLIFERFPQFYSFIDRKIYFWKFKKAAEMADLIIAISEQTKQDIVYFLDIPAEKIRVVYQGCHQAFKENPREEFLAQLREKYNLPQRFILNVGTIEERKNLLSVVKALRGENIPLVVVGKKTIYYKKIEQEIQKNGVEVYFLEKVSMTELVGLYRLADIFIYPSLFEGFGIPIIEALFSETVVITSNQSCLPEAGGKDSVYVNPLDISDIRVKIKFLWENKFERKNRAEKGFVFVQKFSDEVIAKDLIAVYQEVLK